MKEKLKIALIWNLSSPIPVEVYGGIERKIYGILEGLSQKGHDVTLFARSDSRPPCQLVSYGSRPVRTKLDHWRAQGLLTLRAAPRLRGLDIIHSFAKSSYLVPLLPTGGVKVQSYGSPVSIKTVQRMQLMHRGTLVFTGCSNRQSRDVNHVGKWETVYNGADLSIYTPRREYRESYLAFLGRFHPNKGLHHAIEVAKRTGKPLRIAGDVFNENDRSYFDTAIRPHVDGKLIEWIGPVKDHEKAEFLVNAEAMLFPIEWEEPFGWVLIESMACGTPVVAFRRGSVPEVITHGRDGLICSGLSEMVDQISQLPSMDRSKCRETVEQRFTMSHMVDGYEQVYFKYLMSA